LIIKLRFKIINKETSESLYIPSSPRMQEVFSQVQSEKNTVVGSANILGKNGLDR
jgi:hypothetical protein